MPDKKYGKSARKPISFRLDPTALITKKEPGEL
jgi:hypothetical protein